MWSQLLLLWLFASTVCSQKRLNLFEGEICHREGAVNWLCKKLPECIKAQEDLRYRQKVDTCHFEGSTVVVCCEPKSSSRNATFRPGSTSFSKSLQMCRKYAKSVFYEVEGLTDESSLIDTCAVVEPLIVNGTKAEPREFPHMALIIMAGTLSVRRTCGGSLISERFVISAAHCNSWNPKRVRLGDYNIRSTEDDDADDARPVEYDIIEIIQHPKYDDNKTYNDITLYKLGRDVLFDAYIRPICLHTTHLLPKVYAIITGWGSTQFGEPQSPLLLKGNVSFVSWEFCKESLKPALANRQAEVKDDMMICAGSSKNGTDTCQGDSGGPLQYRLIDPYCMYSLVGITSFGKGCGNFEGQPKFPGVYTRVSNYIPWIESIVWP